MGMPAVLAGDRVEPGEELILAEEAAVGGIGRVLGPVELLGLHHHVRKPDMGGEATGLAQLGGGIGLRVRGGQERAIAERVLAAARASRVESTPPEKATTTRSMPRSSPTSRWYFSVSASST